jgi:rhamnose transport system permease protein
VSAQTGQGTVSAGAAPRGRSSRTWMRLSWDKGVVLLLLLTLIVGSGIDSRFANGTNLGFVISDIGEILLIALPMTLLIISGEIDLSVGSTLALSGSVLGWTWETTGSMWLAVAATLLTGTLCGALNGVLVTRLGLGSLAVTIGTLGLYRGLSWALLGDTPVADFPTSWTNLGFGAIPGTPLPYVTPLLVILAVAFGVVLHLTRPGRWIYAIGQSAEAARFAGIPVARVKMRLFVTTGAVAGLASLAYDLRFASARPDAAVGLELAVIASALFGGVSIFGGVGTMWGVVCSVLFLGAIRSLLQLQNVPANALTIITGGLLLTSVIVPVAAARLAGLRRSRSPATGLPPPRLPTEPQPEEEQAATG